MDLASHYNQLFSDSKQAISTNNYVIDFEIDSKSDHRFGITLLIRPSEAIKNKMQSFLNELKELEPSQYYYPNSDIHITVLSIISCHDGFSLNQINPEQYIAVIKENMAILNNLEIEFSGITASNSTIMIQGFPSNDSLNTFRNSLREAFRKTNLQQSIDNRYTLFTAHTSVCRFRKPLASTAKLISFLNKFRNHDFGKFEVNQLELVFNDWYQRKEKTQILQQFKI